MSLLVAANLVDRIYMCADTRLSKYQELNGLVSTIVVHDNLQKMIVLAQPLVVISCVGSPKLASFIIKKIQTEFSNTHYANQLKKIISNNQDIVLSWIDEFITKNSVPYREAKCVLVIAGQNPLHKRTVDGKRLITLAKDYQHNAQKKIDTLFQGKKPEELTQDELARLFHESENNTLSLKEVVIQAIMQKKNGEEVLLELNVPSQTLFAVEIRADNANTENEIITIKNFLWGETAVYGAGLDQKILPPDFFGYLDLRKGSGNFQTDVIPLASAIKDNFGGTIGGGMTNFILMNSDIMTSTNHLLRVNPDTMAAESIFHTEMIDGGLYHYLDNKRERLINFNESPEETETGHLLLWA